MKTFIHSYIAAAILILSLTQTSAQQLQIGQQCPDVVLNNILRYPKGSVRISDFKGKLLILDFWRTSCSGCVAAFPKLDSLQKKFEGKVVIMPVTTDRTGKIDSFFHGNRLASMVSLPSVTNDTVLSGVYVKYQALPHSVWIDGNGIVKAITGSWNIKEDNIQGMLDGKPVHLPLKQDIFDFNFHVPLYAEGGGRDLQYIRNASVFVGHIAGTWFGIDGTDTIGDQLLFYAINFSIPYLYSRILNFHAYTRNKVILNVADPSRFIEPANVDMDEWDSKNIWGYNLMVPLGQDKKIKEYALQDIGRFFNTDAKVEKRTVKCLLLKPIPGNNTWQSKGLGKPNMSAGSNNYFVNNEALIGLTLYWNSSSPLPIICDSSIREKKADMEIHANVRNTASLRRELLKYGLDLVESETTMDMLVISDRL